MTGRRAAYQKRLRLLGLVELQANALLDSNSKLAKKKEDETLQRMLRNIIELLRMGQLNDVRRKDLARILDECRDQDSGYVNLTRYENGTVLSLEGDFDMDRLAERIVWGGPLSESNIIEEG